MDEEFIKKPPIEMIEKALKKTIEHCAMWESGKRYKGYKIWKQI
jgi:hypothetical protein